MILNQRHRREWRLASGLLVAVALLGFACDESPGARDASIADARAGDAAAREDSAPASDGARDRGHTKVDTGLKVDAPVKVTDCKNADPAWLLCDDFEGLSKGVDAWFKAAGWTGSIGKGDPGRIKASTAAHRGKYALHMPAAASAGYQGADLIWRACIGTNKPGCKLKGYPQLYLRAYVKLAADHRYVHHFLNLGGGPVSDYWAPFGNAGCRPNGKRAMGTTVDFKKTHETFFYSYHPSMKCDPGTSCARYADPKAICAGCAKKGMPCNNGLECCWGNLYAPKPPVKLPLGKWFCFEMMMRPNDLGSKNGEMAYWIDGKLAHQAKNMHWRDVAELQMNKARLQHYITTSDAKGFSNQVFFDDVVISTKRVGCQ